CCGSRATTSSRRSFWRHTTLRSPRSRTAFSFSRTGSSPRSSRSDGGRITAMPGLFSIAYADLRSRRLTSALTIIAIALGAAVVVATFATNAAVEDSMARAARSIVGDTDLVVDAVDDQGFATSSVLGVSTLPGVSVVAPQVRRRVFFATASQHGFDEVVGI